MNFDEWWDTDGRYIDPDTDDVPWFDKRKGLAAAAFAAGFHSKSPVAPMPQILRCPACNARHIDKGEFATKPHHTHACQECGMVWRPAIEPTVGVQFLPGFKDGES